MLDRWVDVLVGQRWSGGPGPGHRAAGEQVREQVELLLEQLLVLLEGEPEQPERLDERPAPDRHLGAPTGEGVESREPFEDADRVVRREHRDGRPEPDVLGAGGDRGEDDLGCGDREVVAVVLADPDGVETDLVGEDPLLDDVAQHLRLAEQSAVGVLRDVPERVDAELDGHGSSRDVVRTPRR